MIEIQNNDDFFLIKDMNITIKINKNSNTFEIINNNEEIIIDNNNIKLLFNMINNSYIGFDLYNHFIQFYTGFDIINNTKYFYTTSQIQKNGLAYTNSQMECNEDYICCIKYNSYIISKVLKNIKTFFTNKINITYNEFIQIINDYNIQFNIKMCYSYKMNDTIYKLNIQDIFIQ